MSHRFLRASAGTGKTYRLVEAYCALILQEGLRPADIVAITFTRKAAMELQLRIRGRLRAAGAGASTLRELGHAPLANFHGLALQMLRTLGPGAPSVDGAPAAFAEGTEVLGNGGDDRALFLQSCEDAWFASDCGPEVRGAVEALAPWIAVDSELPEALWEALGRAREDGALLGDEAEPAASNGRVRVAQYSGAAQQAASHLRLLTLRERLVTAQVDGKGQEKLARFTAAPVPAMTAPIETWAQAWRSAFKALDRRGKLGTIYTEDDVKSVSEALDDAVAEHVCEPLGPALALLVQRAWQQYALAKEQRRVLDFADIIERMVHILSTRRDVHAAVRSRCRALLVDEAQDTNRLQRRFIDLLAGFAGPAAGDGDEPARLFVVGDWKQSIYTFRGADAQAFSQFAADLCGRGGTEETLAVSRRSTPALVASINHLGASLFGERYESLEPLHPPASAAAPRPGDAPGMTWFTIAEGSALWQEARAVAAVLAARLAAGASPGDFAVLAATMTHAPVLASALGERGIPAVIGGGGGLYEQPEVLDVLALLTWLCEPRDRLAAAVCLRSPLFGVSDAGLMALFARGAGEDGLTALQAGRLVVDVPERDRQLLEPIVGAMPHWVALADGPSAVALLEAIDHTLHLRALLLALDNGAQRLANVHRLFDLAQSADRRSGASVRSFVRHQTARVRAGHAEPLVPVPSAERQAVTLSSVHQSKGLQYPIVVLAGLGRKGRQDCAAVRYSREHGLLLRPRLAADSGKTARWRASVAAEQDNQQAEMRRLLYVAVTRAEREVLWVGPAPEHLGREGFARFVAPWAPTAMAAGVLARAEAPEVPEFDLAQRSHRDVLRSPRAASNPCEPLATQAPVGTHFEVTVTQLCYWEAPTAGVNALGVSQVETTPWRPLAADLGSLDPQSRGELAHAVLASLEQRDAYGSNMAFIDAELQRLGHGLENNRVAEVAADLVAFLDTRLGRAMLAAPVAARRPEQPFAISINVDGTSTAPAYLVTLRGQIDLVYWDAEGPVIVDYKHAQCDATALPGYLRQLETYAWALMRLGHVGPIRTHLVFLRDRGAAPISHLVTPAMGEEVLTRLKAWTRHHAACFIRAA